MFLMFRKKVIFSLSHTYIIFLRKGGIWLVKN